MTATIARESMSYLEAHRIVSSMRGGEPLSFLLAMSGTADKLDLFVRAAAAKRDRAVTIRTMPFNTLSQALHAGSTGAEGEVFLLLPWDFVPELDWRSGIPASGAEIEALLRGARQVAAQLEQRKGVKILYLPAALPPLFTDINADVSLERELLWLARSLGAQVLPPQAFSLASYLSNGSPVAGTHLGHVASAIIEHLLNNGIGTSKVLVTDLDNVMWSGVVGEDGVHGIRFGPEDRGYRHFLYQTLLAKLKREGVLLAAVSRNDPELARLPFRAPGMVLREEDFVCVVASYNAKSVQIAEMASRLNLGLDSFVFVDDNPLEIAEVTAQIPVLPCLQFPAADDDLPRFFSEIARRFSKSFLTSEDRERAEMYRRRLEGMAPSDAKGADLSTFLRGLEMQLIVHDRSTGDRARAVQLINKTNQFNLNGRRLTDDDVAAQLNAGGRLYTATLSDRTGTHGEILACLIGPEGSVQSLVLSCRVFERRVEYAFMAWLARRQGAPQTMRFAATARNAPVQRFLQDAAFTVRENGTVHFDASAFGRDHEGDLALFVLQDGADDARPLGQGAGTN